MEQLELEIGELLAKAEATDGKAGPEALPREIARREDLKRRMAQARAQAKAERAAHQHLGGAGRAPKPPKEEPEAKQRSNLTDPDSRLMRKHQRAESEQA